MLILNFAHPMTKDQIESVERLTGRSVTDVHDIAVQLDNSEPVAPQITAIVEQIPLTSVQWQTTPFLVSLPGLSIAAAAVVAELHGRSGHFPACVRMRPVADSVPVRFEVAEIVGLEQMRQAARLRRDRRRRTH